MSPRVWQHMRALWPRFTLLPPLPFILFGLFKLARGEARIEHVALIFIVPALAYGNALTKKLCVGLYPIGMVGIFYDAMKLIQNLGVTPERVHNCDLRAVEAAWFGLAGPGGERITLHDWFQAHATPTLDLICAVPYGTFIMVSMAFAIWLIRRDFASLLTFGWSFFALNVVGFITYHVFPAAPPWYYHAHGCVVDLGAKASSGPNLARVDAWLGFEFFGGMYGRSSDVFGAVPSLHVAYPLLIFLIGWPFWRLPGRVLSFAFFAWMCFAAVYLDHHWVIDILAGITYCVVMFVVGQRVKRAWQARATSSHQAVIEGEPA